MKTNVMCTCGGEVTAQESDNLEQVKKILYILVLLGCLKRCEAYGNQRCALCEDDRPAAPEKERKEH